MAVSEESESMQIYYNEVVSPIGRLLLVGHSKVLKRIEFEAGKHVEGPQPGWRKSKRELAEAEVQLSEYFAGERQRFTLNLDPEGTEFQRQTWDLLRRIPYGKTVSYSDIARLMGRPKAVRAVGAANGRNPIPIVVPCHRVIGRDGSLTGFAAGTDVKKKLLELEGVTL